MSFPGDGDDSKLAPYAFEIGIEDDDDDGGGGGDSGGDDDRGRGATKPRCARA